MPIVVDCSVAAAWALSDERTEWTLAALQTATADGAIVPSLFWYEIRNILIINEGRKRIDLAQSTTFLTAIDPLITMDNSTVGADVLELARVHGLTVYDASYLELARRLDEPLCTLDNQLIQSAPRIGITLWQP